jgi:hypothetical protein
MRKKLEKCYIQSIAVYGAATWTLQKLDHKYLDSFEMWCWRKMERINWTVRVKNEEVLQKSQRGKKHLKYNKRMQS